MRVAAATLGTSALGLVAVLSGCGGGAPRPAPAAEVTSAASRAATLGEPDARFAGFELQCRDRLGPCPASVGMLLRAEGEAVERCTAALVGPRRVLTASHCLPPAARADGAACDGAWILFAATGDRPHEWAGCRRVLRASSVTDDRVMRRDVALLELDRVLARPALPIDGRAPEEGSVVTVLSARQHPIYPAYNELVPRLCRVATRESAVETFGPDAAAVGWLMDCPSYPGNSGSPILDAAGRLRSVMHAGSAPFAGVAVTSDLE